MVNVIIPLREAIATQISPFFSEKLGIPKLYFDKYEARYNVDRSSEAYKYSLSVNQMIQAYATSMEMNSKMPQDIQNGIMEALQMLTTHITNVS